MVVGFLRGRWVYPRALRCSLGSSVGVGFTRGRPGGRWVIPGSLTLSLGVVVFIQDRWVSLACALGFVRFIRGHWGHSRANRRSLSFLASALGVVEFIRGRRIHSCSPLGSLGSTVVGVFAKARPGGRWVPTGPFGSPLFFSVHPGPLQFAGVQHGCRWVHPRSLGSLARALVVDELIRGRCVHTRGPWLSLGSFGGVVHQCAHWWSMSSSGVARFTRSGSWVTQGRWVRSRTL